MELEEAIYSKLSNDAGVSALVGTRIYPNQAPQDAPFPLIVYQQASQIRTRSLRRYVNLNGYMMQIDVFGDDYASVKAVTKAVLDDCLLGFEGTLGSGDIIVRGVFVEDEGDDFDPPINADEHGIHSCSFSLKIWYKRGA